MCGFTDRADSVLRTLDAPGVGQALFVGHSMDGRMTIQLAAVAVPNLRYPPVAARTIRAIIESGDYTPMLHTMRDEGMPPWSGAIANPAEHPDHRAGG
ncbi:hypothetical protein BST14_25310 [Mycobacterium arosiense ATCC BAA-1401 = DSM 45069]|uniref:Uncharacterized protein n=1 Tax=Mycobacterium arosiense ATCC BAA-1401 = DSM 45069 TaxID=1265311 RepID=A0A1W9Z6L4_MYCAI|nr:hypothetical protein BST14_25310 [Mycobacterium arosiense ATCC BAA-1401 = DSM 45069]